MKNTLQTTLRITEQQAENLDFYAEKLGLSRNQLICNLIATSLDDLAMLDRFGFLRMGAGIRDLLRLAKNEDDLNSADPNRMRS